MKTQIPTATTRSARAFVLATVASLLLTFSSAFADPHTAGVRDRSSRPGAAYTLYLNPAGFNFSGIWEVGKPAPGTTPALNDRAPTDTFTMTEQDQIDVLWARVAQSYIGFNVNVTTVDPAIAAGMATTDAMRQSFYDNTPNMMHTIIGSQFRDDGMGGQTKWYANDLDGISGLGVAAGTGSAGSHTNFMFTEAQAGAATSFVVNGGYIGAVTAHEDAHAFGLNHQGDYTASSRIEEYGMGDGDYVPIIGQADGAQRITWRSGSATDGGRIDQNDVAKMISTSSAATATSEGRTGGADLHLIDDGIGHTTGTATTLALNGDGTVDFNIATGVIVPKSESSPEPKGAENYTEDYFKFTLANTSDVVLTANNSTHFLTPGVADGKGTLRSVLYILDAAGDVLFTSIEEADTFSTTYSGTLDSGEYYARVNSFGGHDEAPANTDLLPAQYYDMGAYFITGSVTVPEPGTLSFLIVGASLFVVRRRRAR